MENQNKVYSENFEKTIQPESLNYVLNQIRAVHSADAGWKVGPHKILRTNSDGTITISVPLEKYEMQNEELRRCR